jgi:hypothetical protein
MKKIIAMCVLVCVSAFQTSLMADNKSVRGDNYWIVELGQATLGEDGTYPGADEMDDIYANLAFGYRYNTYLSAEANLWWWQLNHITTPDALSGGQSEGQKVNFSSGVGISLRGDMPIWKKLGAFAQVSFNMLNFDLVGQKPNGHDSGFGYSGGLQYEVKQGSVFVRYAVLLDNETDDPDDFQAEDFTSIGVGYKWDLPF